jgi:hypothetical protein
MLYALLDLDRSIITKEAFINVRNIFKPKDIERDYRSDQNYVGSLLAGVQYVPRNKANIFSKCKLTSPPQYVDIQTLVQIKEVLWS